MSGRPRIVIATPLPAEREVLATGLASEGFEPVQAATPQAAAEYTQSHPFDLLIADAGFALRDGLHAATRGRTRNPRTPAIVIGDFWNVVMDTMQKGLESEGRAGSADLFAGARSPEECVKMLSTMLKETS